MFPDTGLVFCFHVAMSGPRPVAGDCERYIGILLKKRQIFLADFLANSFLVVVRMT